MDKPTIEKFYRDGRDFFIVVWDKGDGILFEEVFEAKKISERNATNEKIGDVLTKAKSTIDVGIASKSI